MNKFIVFDFSETLVKMRPPALLISKAALRRLDSKFTLGIITGGSKTEVINILIKLNILELFKRKNILTKSDTFLKKPNPKLLLKLIKGFEIKNCIYIGDKIKDYKMANALGMRFIYVGKRKLGIAQLNYKYPAVEKIANKLLSSKEVL